MSPPAGSFFALEVLHRQGLQFFEIAVYGVTSGTICLVVYRGLSWVAFGQVWQFPVEFPVVDFRHVLAGNHHHPLPLINDPCTRTDSTYIWDNADLSFPELFQALSL